MTLPPNLVLATPFATDITFAITVVLLLPLRALTLLSYATTPNLFLQNLFLTQTTLLPLESTLSFLNVLLFLLIIILVTFSLAQLLKISVFFQKDHLLNIDLTTDQNSTPPTPNRVDYLLIVNNTLIENTYSPRRDPRFLYLATHKHNSNPHISDTRRRKEFLRLEETSLELKFEINVKFHNLSPHPIPSHTTVNFKSLPHPFIATNLNLFVSDHPPFRLLHGSITFLNTLTFLKYTAQF